MKSKVWLVRLSTAAAADFQDIIDWTDERFGLTQANVYEQSLKDALSALEAGADVTGARPRSDIGENYHALHMARRGRRGRHVILFQVGEVSGRPVVDVLRILHDAMDFLRHVPKSDELE